MKVAIFCNRYLDYDGKERLIGGVETYLYNLANLCMKMDIKPIIFQYAHNRVERIVDDIKVVGLPVLQKRTRIRRVHAFKLASQEFDIENDIVIFGTDGCSVSYGSNRCVSIQHGISWDLPNHIISPRKIWRYRLTNELFRMKLHWHAIRVYERCPNHVFVDYNFPNWYRTFRPCELTGNNWIIPNFANIPDANIVRNARNDACVVKILGSSPILRLSRDSDNGPSGQFPIEEAPTYFFYLRR